MRVPPTSKEEYYCFDTSAFIESWHRWYPRDVFPSIWSHLEDDIDKGLVSCPEAVKDELQKKTDDLYVWTTQQRNLFYAFDLAIQTTHRKIINRHPELTKPGKGRSAGDPWVIAFAQNNNLTVVTFEVATNSLKRPRIPDVCLSCGVPCLSMLEYLRGRGLRL